MSELFPSSDTVKWSRTQNAGSTAQRPTLNSRKKTIDFHGNKTEINIKFNKSDVRFINRHCRPKLLFGVGIWWERQRRLCYVDLSAFWILIVDDSRQRFGHQHTHYDGVNGAVEVVSVCETEILVHQFDASKCAFQGWRLLRSTAWVDEREWQVDCQSPMVIYTNNSRDINTAQIHNSESNPLNGSSAERQPNEESARMQILLQNAIIVPRVVAPPDGIRCSTWFIAIAGATRSG